MTPRLAQPVAPAEPTAYMGIVSKAPVGLGLPFEAIVPAFAEHLVFQIVRWEARGNTIPEVGDEVLVLKDERGEPWVPVWWPANGDAAIGGGEKGDTGPGIYWEGPWVEGASYALNEVVSYLGSSYIAIKAGSGKKPSEQPTYWQLVAEKGATGAEGAKGATGAEGAAGTTVIRGAVKASGEKETGSTGFTSEKTATGLYKIVLSSELATVGAMVAMPVAAARAWRQETGFQKKTFTLQFTELGGAAADSAFVFQVVAI